MSVTIKDITTTQTVLNADDYFELQENAGTSKKTMWSTIRDTIASFIGAGSTVYKEASYAILDGDGYGRIEVNTTAGAATITLPLMANNIGRKITIAFVKNDASADVVTISPHATDANKLSNDGLASIILPKVGNYVSLVQSSNSGFWEITDESITSQLRLNTYAGYGSTDNKIMRFTNVVENFGNMFSENHVSGYSGNAKGLEITINRSGLYSITFDDCCQASAIIDSGLTLNSSQLTTSISTVTQSTILSAHYTSAQAGIILPATTTVTMYFKKGDVIRPHTTGTTPTIAARVFFSASYLGN
jgi:hypothetical protein